MKKHITFKYCFLAIIPLFLLYSCNDDSSEFSDPVTSDLFHWHANTNIVISPADTVKSIVLFRNLIDTSLSWKSKTVQLNMDLNSPLLAENFSKIDIYITAEEKDGYNYTAPFDTTGILYKTISDITDNSLSIVLDGNELGKMFETKFKNPRSGVPLLEGDIFELHWVLTNMDGNTLDSRDYIDPEYRFGVGVKVLDSVPPILAGEFSYKWIEASDDAMDWGIELNYTGNITIGLKEGTTTSYNVSDLTFGYNYLLDFDPALGYIEYDYVTGLITVTDQALIDYGQQETSWEIIKVDDRKNITIKYTNLLYPTEYGTIQLTRSDDNDWPNNLHTAVAE